MQYEKVIDYINSVEKEGGRFVCGGQVPDQPGYFIPVTMAVDLADDSRLVKEEPFGPVLPLLRFSDVDDVIARANDSPYGLGASVWSKDIRLANQIAARIESGSVWINHHMAKKADAPFGGIKESGIGVENTALGLAEFTNVQVIRSPK
jgi:acyl-CoA reductase-like NAD-dependent aldehyde dehydrogenase